LNKLVTIFLFILTVNSVKAQYTGGDNDGNSDGLLSQSSCPDLTPNFIYYGGINDGAGDGLLTQSNCPNLTPNFAYYGGINDGAGDGLLTQSNCPNLTPNFTYYGGVNDGAGDGLLTQSNCPDLTPNFTYYGGINDGFSNGTLTQSACPDLTPNFTYYGGINDGFGWHYTQPQICTTPLPIELLEFAGICDGTRIKLKWSTATETNNDYFTIERGSDGVNFNILDTIAGAGNSYQTLHYTFIDENVMEAIYYYRLKQTDFNGAFKYSKLIALTCNGDFSQDIVVYPNPVTNELNIEIPGNMQSVNFEIISSTGAVVNKGSLNQKTKVQTSGFASGIYMIKFANDYIFGFKKVIKQ
jgi:hypothetical protein